MTSPIKLRDFFTHFKGEPHQLAAIDELQAAMPASLLKADSSWVQSFRAAPAAKDPLPPAWLAPALKIIKEFEGCHLHAYLCPANVPTIGWGSTQLNGRPVQLGDTITQAQADAMLTKQVLEQFGPGVLRLIPSAAKWKPDQIAAITSFAFNVGLGALEGSTLRQRLNAGQPAAQVVAEELPRWNKGDKGPLPGLVRRRAAEVALFGGSLPTQQQAIKLSPGSPFNAKITPHFTLGEFALGQPARRFVAQHQVDTATELATFLERVRAQFGGKRITITSGFRPPAINRSVNGASSSEHLYDAPGVGAVDFYVDGADIRQVQSWCDKNFPYSVGYGAPKGFVHLGIRKGRPRVRWDY
jgi:GH24 family phage-related lysozyme (muramidase)